MIITKTGKKFEAKGLLFDQYIGCFHLVVKNSTVKEIMDVFKDPKETSVLIYKTEKVEKKFDGYTILANIVKDGDDLCITMQSGGGLGG